MINKINDVVADFPGSKDGLVLDVEAKLDKKSKNIEIYYLAMPFAFGRNVFKIRNEGTWTVLDLLILRAIVKKKCTLDEFVVYSNIKRQLLIQIIIPFLKLGWVEIEETGDKLKINATKLGELVASQLSLPASAKVYDSTRDYLIDLVTGKYFGLINYKNLRYYSYIQIQELQSSRPKDYIFVKNMPSAHRLLDTILLGSAVVRDYEEVVSLVDVPSYIVDQDKYLIFTIKVLKESEGANNVLVSFYQKHDSELSNDLTDFFSKDLLSFISLNFEKIKNKFLENNANIVDKNVDQVLDDSFGALQEVPNLKTYSVNRADIKLILGGSEHKKIFYDLLAKANSYIVIHSTFIGMWVLDECISFIIDALDRGVRIIILWGKDDFDEPEVQGKENDSFDKITKKISDLSILYDQQIVLHDIQTGSHAKFILSDHSEFGDVVVLGSCNWLFTQFCRYEASVLIKSSLVVKEFLNISASLATGRMLTSNYLSKEILDLSNNLKVSKKIKIPKGEEVSVALLLKDQHYFFIQKAKKAIHRITITSDRINDKVNRAVWDVLKTVNVNVNAFYSSPVAPDFNHSDALNKAKSLKNANVRINLKVHAPPSGGKNHSKVLAWDKSHIIVTSLNWMSSDASKASYVNDKYHEIGLYLNGAKLEQEFVANFKESISV
jgi:hypothetical protein